MTPPPATLAKTFTPPQVAARHCVKPAKVLGWIRAGELRAIDVSTRPGIGRPRYRIDPQDLFAFEQRRAGVATPVKSSRRSRKPAGVIEFFK